MPDVTIPIISNIIHPPLGVLRRDILPGIYAGSGDLTRATGALPPFNNVNAYGLAWSVFSIPIGYGFVLGDPVYFDERLVQLSTIHADFEGHELVSEYHDFHVEGIYWLWENAGPSRIHYEISPGVQLVLYWLTVHL